MVESRYPNALAGQVALVTGAARYRGIGRAIALRLAADGADIVICGRDKSPDTFPPHEQEMNWQGVHSVADEIRNMGRKALSLACDITEKDQVVGMIDAIKSEFGRLDIIVNNAGDPSNAGASPIFETSEEVWNHTMDVNINGVFLVCKYGGMLMRDGGNGGSIVQIASMAGRVGLADYGAYCASKFAVIGLTQQLALETADMGIRVNCVSPGSHDTDMMDSTFGRITERFGLPEGAAKAQTAAYPPMKRQGQAHELAAVVSFVCSPDASYLTGQTINVDGGMRMD